MTRSMTSTISAIGRHARCCACAARRRRLTASSASGVRTGRDKQMVSGPVPKVKLVVAIVSASQPGKKYGGASTVGIDHLLALRGQQHLINGDRTAAHLTALGSSEQRKTYLARETNVLREDGHDRVTIRQVVVQQ